MVTFTIDEENDIIKTEIESIHNNNNNNNNNNKSSSSNNYYDNLYNNIISVISNKYYSSIIYLIKDKGFTYQREIKNALAVDSMFYLKRLESMGILEKYEITNTEKDMLKSIHNLGEYHFKKMKFFSLTPQARKIMEKDMIDDIINRNTDISITYIKSNQVKKYRDILNEREEKEDWERRKREHLERIRQNQIEKGLIDENGVRRYGF